VLTWNEPAWLREAETWIEEHASVTGELEQFHVRWWSTVIRVPTAEDDLYFKATAHAHRFEAALTAKLAARMPDRVPEVIAVDPDRGWLLLRDGGKRLRELIEDTNDLHHWEAALPRYGELQLELAAEADELLAIGVPDRRLAVLPDQLRALLREGPAGLTPVELELIETAAPEVEALCRELADYGIRETIQHDDLHEGQVFVQDGRYLFFDWGDSCVSHPFHTLTVTLRAAAFKLDLEPGGPELQRLRAAYLEPFGDFTDAAEIAYRTGTIARALAWHRYVSAAGVHAEPEDQSAAAYGLKLFLENGPIGTWREPETSRTL